nr:glycosyltransferase [uncultured Desulfobacter sp.]
MKKIKIIHFFIGNIRGGITRYLLNNWKFINKEDFHFDFVTKSKKIDFEQELKNQGCKIYHISCYAEEDEKKFRKEISDIFARGYDIAHIHTAYWKSFIIEELAVKYNVQKIIVHAHNTMIHDDFTNEKREDARCLHEKCKSEFNIFMATDFCACSRLAADWLFGVQIPKERIKILNNAIDIRQFQYNPVVREEYRKMLGLENRYVIGHIGRMSYQKNHEFLIHVFHRVLKKVQNSVLLLINDGPLEENIRTQVLSLGIESKVLFLGKRDDTENLYQAMDVFCLPSRFEGLPIVLVEAQVAGLKCITSDKVSEEAKITDNLDFLPFNIELWKDRIAEILQGYERRNMNHEISISAYNISDQILALENLYRLNAEL